MLIIGFGMTGQSLAKFCDQKKLRYLILDDQVRVTHSSPYFVAQQDQTSVIKAMTAGQIRAIFPSPGVSSTHPVILKAQENHIPIVGELELASLYLTGEFIAVTGTNGKSTTVRLIHALLKNAGIANRLSGNIGAPLIDAVHEPPTPFYVVEESSFQLELIGSLRHHIAICLNVTEDHFERYKNIADYAAAKKTIIKNSTAADWFIYNADDKYCRHLSENSPVQKLPFSLVNPQSVGAHVDKTAMNITLNGQQYRFELNPCRLKGVHNWENMLAALTTVLLIKNEAAAVESYRKTLANFVGLPHRVEKVHEENGVSYYDDSKGTNVGSVVMALASFDGNVILIAGGKDKLCDYSPLKGLVKAKVKTLVLLGEAKERLAESLKGIVPIVLTQNMDEAVNNAKKVAKPGDVVLLSPACSSYDQYKNYKERGLHFQRCVKQST